MSRSMKNPDEDVFPHRDPSYPIQPRIDTATHMRARIVILAVPGEAKFVASTLEDPKVSVSAPTRKAAQEAALRAYVAKHSPMRANPEPVANKYGKFATPEEEAYFGRIIRSRKSERTISADKWLNKRPRAAK